MFKQMMNDNIVKYVIVNKHYNGVKEIICNILALNDETLLHILLSCVFMLVEDPSHVMVVAAEAELLL